jgi:riboflavin kinase / FMN adenylyltransferase
MQTFHQLDDIPRGFDPTIVSVGNFDGVHRAHLRVINEIVRRAKAANACSVVVTFEPHPSRILRPDHAPKLLTPLPEKLRLLESTGIDAVLLLPFSRDLSLMTPHQFAHEILKKRLRAREVHEGYNFHFGHKAGGNVEILREFGREMEFEVHDYPEMRLRGESVSSSHIRKLILEGRVSRARHLLGRPFSILSAPGRGRGYGSKYTVPTINLAHYEELVPKDGAYITRTRVGGEREKNREAQQNNVVNKFSSGFQNDECFNSVTNVGNRPTFGADSFAIETHLLNFHPLELKAETEVEIYFLDRLRDEIKFPSVEALREQIGRDVKKAQRYLGRVRQAGVHS